MKPSKRPPALAPHLEAALRQAWVGYPDKLQPLTVDVVRTWVAESHAAGKPCFVRSEGLYRLPGVPDPQPSAHPARVATPCVGHRDTFIDLDGRVFVKDTITNQDDPSYRKDTAS